MLCIKTASASDALTLLERRRLDEVPSQLEMLEDLLLFLLPCADISRCLSAMKGGMDSSGPYLTIDGFRPGERLAASSESYTLSEIM